MKTKSPKSTKKASAKKATRKAPEKNNSCLCGCGTKVAGTFAQGHDARLKGLLLRGEVKSPNAEQKAFAKHHGVKIGSKAKKAA
jgi:hypothetical protein